MSEPKKRNAPKGYIGVNEICELFSVSRKTVYTMIADKRLKQPLKFGRMNLWDEKEIQTSLKHAKFCK